MYLTYDTDTGNSMTEYMMAYCTGQVQEWKLKHHELERCWWASP